MTTSFVFLAVLLASAVAAHNSNDEADPFPCAAHNSTCGKATASASVSPTAGHKNGVKARGQRLLGLRRIPPDVVVAADGTGHYTKISDAVDAAWARVHARKYFVIYIKSGTYNENVTVSHFSNKTGHDTPHSATLTAIGSGFMARDLTIENTAGASDDKQAVAFRSTSNRSVLYRCELKGFQDTLYAESGLQFYRNYSISGTIDFVFGDATALFQGCLLLVRRPSVVGPHNVITAQGRNAPESNTGFSFQNCTITTHDDLTGVETYLGRPWKIHALVVFMMCAIDDIVHRRGWVAWNKNETLVPTVVYREYKNYRLGTNVSQRSIITNWPGVHFIKSDDAAAQYTAQKFIHGSSWLPETGVEFNLGLYS